MPFVHVHWLEGRDDQQKAELARRITEAVSEVGGAPPESVWVRIEDMKKTDFAVGGVTKDQA